MNRSTVGTVAVIGPAIGVSASDAGYYGPRHTQFYPQFPSVLDAVQSGGKVKTVTAAGVPKPSSEDQSRIHQAVNVAKGADTVILAVGTDITMASEPHDAKNISFTDAQAALIEQVAAAAKRPVIVLLLTATPLDLTSVLANPKVGAVLHLGVPSVTVLGIDAILYGDLSPAAKTVQTFHDKSYQETISIFGKLSTSREPWCCCIVVCP
jgi:beta-D-xylosidase 4